MRGTKFFFRCVFVGLSVTAISLFGIAGDVPGEATGEVVSVVDSSPESGADTPPTEPSRYWEENEPSQRSARDTSGARWSPAKGAVTEGGYAQFRLNDNSGEAGYINAYWNGTERAEYNTTALVSIFAGNGTRNCMLRINGCWSTDSGSVVKCIDIGAGPEIRPASTWKGTGRAPISPDTRTLYFKPEGYLFDCE
jgi:hypothetical protein